MLKYDPSDSEFPSLAEGDYTFQIKSEPEKRKNDAGKVFIIFKLNARDPAGSVHKYSEVFAPWDERFKDLLLALGGKSDEAGIVHLSETETIGKEFRGQIRTIWDEKNKKNRQRIVDIRAVDYDDIPEPPLADEDVPF